MEHSAATENMQPVFASTVDRSNRRKQIHADSRRPGLASMLGILTDTEVNYASDAEYVAMTYHNFGVFRFIPRTACPIAYVRRAAKN